MPIPHGPDTVIGPMYAWVWLRLPESGTAACHAEMEFRAQGLR